MHRSQMHFVLCEGHARCSTTWDVADIGEKQILKTQDGENTMPKICTNCSELESVNADI